MPIRAVFLDAGNTIVFPDFKAIFEGEIEPSLDQVISAERNARQELDSIVLTGKSSESRYWHLYFRALVGDQEDRRALIERLSNRVALSTHWNQILPGTREILLELKANYGLGVISNSDGNLCQLLHAVNLGDCFDCILDSARVGFRKPGPEIFKIALSALRVKAEDSVYVGDLYSIDYCGAMMVGMQPILFDRFAAYETTVLRKISTLSSLSSAILLLEKTNGA